MKLHHCSKLPPAGNRRRSVTCLRVNGEEFHPVPQQAVLHHSIGSKVFVHSQNRPVQNVYSLAWKKSCEDLKKKREVLRPEKVIV